MLHRTILLMLHRNIAMLHRSIVAACHVAPQHLCCIAAMLHRSILHRSNRAALQHKFKRGVVKKPHPLFSDPLPRLGGPMPNPKFL
jgi:hypothetical protein